MYFALNGLFVDFFVFIKLPLFASGIRCAKIYLSIFRRKKDRRISLDRRRESFWFIRRLLHDTRSSNSRHSLYERTCGAEIRPTRKASAGNRVDVFLREFTVANLCSVPDALHPSPRVENHAPIYTECHKVQQVRGAGRDRSDQDTDSAECPAVGHHFLRSL